MTKVILVNRNKGAQEWAQKNGYKNIQVIETFDVSMVDKGDTVIGILPFFLAEQLCSKGAFFESFVIDFTPEMRGKSLTLEELEQANARVIPLEVKKVGFIPTAKNIVVTRHKGAVKWLSKQGIESEVKEHFTLDDMSEVDSNTTVIGVLPINMVAELNQKGGKFIALDMNVPRELWKEEISSDKMDELGAKLTPYEVSKK